MQQRECCNPDCEWVGETDRMLGEVGPLCPECGEVTEPVKPPPLRQDSWGVM